MDKYCHIASKNACPKYKDRHLSYFNESHFTNFSNSMDNSIPIISPLEIRGCIITGRLLNIEGGTFIKDTPNRIGNAIRKIVFELNTSPFKLFIAVPNNCM